MEDFGSRAPPLITRRHVQLMAVSQRYTDHGGSSFRSRLDGVADSVPVTRLSGATALISTNESSALIQRAENIIESARAVREAAESAAAARAVRDDRLAGLIRIAFDDATLPDGQSNPASSASFHAPRYFTALELVHAMADAEAIASSEATGSTLARGSASGRGRGTHGSRSPPRHPSTGLFGGSSAESSKSLTSAFAGIEATRGRGRGTGHPSPEAGHQDYGLESLESLESRSPSRGDAMILPAAAAAIYEAATQATSSPQLRHLSSFARHGLKLSPSNAGLHLGGASAHSISAQQRQPAAPSTDAHGSINNAAGAAADAASASLSPLPLSAPRAGRAHSSHSYSYHPSTASDAAATPPASSRRLLHASASSSSLGDGLGLRMHMSLADMTSTVDMLAESHVRRSEAAAAEAAAESSPPRQAYAPAAAASAAISATWHRSPSSGSAYLTVAGPLLAPPAGRYAGRGSSNIDIAGALHAADFHAAASPPASTQRQPLGVLLQSASASRFAMEGSVSEPQAASSPAVAPASWASPSLRHRTAGQVSVHTATVLSPGERDIRRAHAHVDESMTQLMRQLRSR